MNKQIRSQIFNWEKYLQNMNMINLDGFVKDKDLNPGKPYLKM